MKNQSHRSRNTIFAITSYPNPGSGLYGPRDHFSAISWHSERTITELSRHSDIIVVAEMFPNYLPSFKVNDHLEIKRLWRKGDWISFILLPFRLLRYISARTIYVQFEFNVFGGIVPDLLLLLNIAIWRLAGKQIVFELHQIIWDVKKLEKHIYLHSRIAQWIISRGLLVYYFVIGILSHKVIVFETELAHRLSHVIATRKIHVLSIATKNVQNDEKDHLKAKHKLGYASNDFVLLVFGYVSGYKGIDWILRAMKHIPSKRIKLLIAGGPSPTLAHNKEYQNFYQSILRQVEHDPRVRATGFISDEDVSTYFSASDLVVLPYQVFMSGSGPFSWALSHEKPIVLSHVLHDYLKSPDVQNALKNVGVNEEEMIFSLQYQKFADLVIKIQKDSALQEKLHNVSCYLNQSRSIDKVVGELFQIISTPQTEVAQSNELSFALEE